MKYLRPLSILSALTGFALLTGCSTAGIGSMGGEGTVIAHRPHNPEAVKVYVSLRAQNVYVMEGDRVLMAAATNVGAPGHSTPRGSYRIESKLSEKRSGDYGFWVRGGEVVAGEAGHDPGAGYHYVGYPMAWWCEFEPGYGFHQGYVWPVPRTHGCLRLSKNVAPKFYALVRIGTPVNIAESQPYDETIGKHVPRPTDYKDNDPPGAFMVSSRVFEKPAGELLSD